MRVGQIPVERQIPVEQTLAGAEDPQIPYPPSPILSFSDPNLGIKLGLSNGEVHRATHNTWNENRNNSRDKHTYARDAAATTKTAKSPPKKVGPFTFPEFDSFSFFDTSLASPSRAAAGGPSLLDDQETSALADFFDKVGAGSDSVFMFDPKKVPLFDPKLPDPLTWGWREDTRSK
ncbi:hypothetical protein TWF694_000313 [Orbilia ellipsospora]|uniref:Uncharacterized protein n=1 Tax=Orbilia ellipsospora TaxID=2528407 RepID=A0AAV9XQT0_9PEZI